MSKPSTVIELLGNQEAAPWARAMQRGKKLQQLSRWVQSALDAELAKHCQAINLRGNTLYLATDATVWATRLRYQLPSLLRSLQERHELRDLRDIQVRVIPATAAAPSKPHRRASLSAESADCLQQCAEAVADETLSSALRRLAGRHRRKD